LEALTGLRGVAALSVLLAHGLDTAFSYGGQPWIYHSFASRLAWFGMSLFFVLSGFVIQLNYGEMFRKRRLREATYQFAVARFSRLYPLYCVAIALTLGYLPTQKLTGFGSVLAHLTLTQTWVNMQDMVFAPGWSISAEWFFYCAFVPLTFAVAWIRKPGIALAVFLAVVPIGLIAAFKYNTEIVAALTPFFPSGSSVFGWIIYSSPMLRCLEFIAGMMAARVYQNRAAGEGPIKGADLIAWACLGWGLLVILPANFTKGELWSIAPNFIFAPTIAAFLVVSSCSRTFLGSILERRSIVFVGTISYSVYIWSWFAITVMDKRYESAAPSALAYFNSSIKLAMIVGATIVFATGSYYLIEVPAQRWLRARLQRAPARRPSSLHATVQ
jgi:peptidoglycan/LPS O-acetylase OafA/YrhL